MSGAPDSTRPVGGFAQGLDDFRPTTGVGCQKVRRDRFRRPLPVDEHLRRESVQAAARNGGDVVVDRGPDQGVHEPQRFARVEHVHVDERVGERRAAGRLEAGQLRHRPVGRLLAEHGHGPRQRGSVGVEPADPDEYRRADPAGCQLVHRGRVQLDERPVSQTQLGEQHGEQERVAPARVVAGAAQLVARRRVQPGADQRPDGRSAERPGPQYRRSGLHHQ